MKVAEVTLRVGCLKKSCCTNQDSRNNTVIRLNNVTKLDSLMVTGKNNWVNSALEEWRADGFLQDN
jgi:hypothetical protein